MGRDEEMAREMGLDPHDTEVDSLEMKRNKRREDALEAWENQNGVKRGAIAAAKQAVSGAFFNKASTPVNLAFDEKGDDVKTNPNAYRYSSSMEKGSYRDSSSVSPQLGLGHVSERERKADDERLPTTPPTAPKSPPPLLPPLSTFGEKEIKTASSEAEDNTEQAQSPPGLPPPLEQKGPLPTLDLGFGSEMRTELGLPEPDPEEVAKVEAETRAAAAPIVPPRPYGSMKRQRAPSAPTLLNRKSFEKAEADLKEKEVLLSDISNIRKSIDELRSKSIDELRVGGDAEVSDTGNKSMSDFPVRKNSKRMKSQSTQSFAMRAPNNEGDLKLTEWEQYVRSRQVFAPPAGVSKPINQEMKDMNVEVSPAVAAAIEKRKNAAGFSGVGVERHNPVTAALESEDCESVSPKQQVFDDDLHAPARSRAHSQSHSFSHSHSNSNSAPGSRKNSIPFNYEIGRATPTLGSRRPSASPSGGRAYSNDNVVGNMSHTRTSTINAMSKFDSSDYGEYNNRNRSRSMTVEELQARHRAHLSRLQSPINQKFELDRRMSEYEAMKGASGGSRR